MAHKIAQARQAEKKNEHISLSMTETIHTKSMNMRPEEVTIIEGGFE